MQKGRLLLIMHAIAYQNISLIAYSFLLCSIVHLLCPAIWDMLLRVTSMRIGGLDNKQGLIIHPTWSMTFDWGIKIKGWKRVTNRQTKIFQELQKFRTTKGDMKRKLILEEKKLLNTTSSTGVKLSAYLHCLSNNYSNSISEQQTKQKELSATIRTNYVHQLMYSLDRKKNP